MDIIIYLIQLIQYQYKIIGQLLNFICKYIPLKQWAFDDSHSPKYQKFKVDKLPKIIHYEVWNYKDFIPYIEWRYGKKIKPIRRRNECDIPDDCICPRCNAPKSYLYKNNGSKGQIWCKVCDTKFSPQENRFSKINRLRCPHCSRILEPIKSRKHYIIHKPKGKIDFKITQVIGLTNDDEVSKEHRPFKQMIERLNRTYKQSYRPTNGFDNINGANYDLALWVAYYNFLRPHKHKNYRVLNKVEMLNNAPNMPGKWQLLIFLGQQTILKIQNENGSNCS